MAKAACRSGVCLLAAVALAEGAFLAGNFLLIVAAAFALIAMSGFLGYGILDAWQQRRSRGQLPPGPSQGHRASEGRRRGDGVTPGGISPMRADRPERLDPSRPDPCRLPRLAAGAGSWSPFPATYPGSGPAAAERRL